MSDPRRLAAELYDAMLRTQRDGGDAALVEAMNLLGQGTGQNKFRHAGAVIGGIKLGRRAIDDRAALRRIAAFPACRRREAVGIVARQVAGANAGDERVEAIAQRLRRKLRANETNTLVKFAASAS
jgi:hypothetical protein